VDRQDIDVLQLGLDLDLAQEALRADHCGHFGLEHFDGDLTIVLRVVGEIDGGHAAAPDLTFDPVAGGERGSEAIELIQVAHPSPAALNPPAASGHEGFVPLQRRL